MDPITAIGLAASIVSFIDFSWNLLTGAKELYESGCRRTKENARISSIVDDLNEYALELTIGGEGASKHEKALRALANDCQSLSEELAKILQKLEMTKNSRWQSLKKIWEAKRKAGDVSLIESRLEKYRAQMNTRLLALLSEQQSSIKSQLDSIQNEAEKLSSASANELKEMRDDVTAILTKVQDMGCTDDSSSSDEDETDEQAQRHLFQSLDDIMDRLSKLKGALQVIPMETRVLQHLYFEDMFAREDSIENPSEGTFAWITMTDPEFEKYVSSWETDSAVSETESQSNDPTSATSTEKMNESRQLLRKWLTYGHGAFHISGKAGAGKSTLMKFIYHDTRAKDCLEQWVDGKTLVLASFYFWRSDRQKLQMSLDGLYRSILFGILRKCPHLIPDVFPDQWRIMSPQSASVTFEGDLFRPLKIKEAFEILMQKPVQSEKFAFCFFIDGLDEYDADPFEHKVLARHLRDWSIKSNIKMCVSSRPEIEFLDIFREDLRIHLHELTAQDICRSSQDMFEQDETFPKVKGIYLGLLKEIVNMAEGVFLWACLVVKSLIVEAGRDANSERLWETLRSTPAKLDDVYYGMLNALNRKDRKTVDYILLLMLTNPFDTPLNAICLSWLYGAEDFRFPGSDDNYSDQETVQQLESVRRRLQGLTKGLLNLAPDTSDLGKCPMFSRRVQFFHRTARDYLETPERKSKLNSNFPDFDAYQIHSILRLAELSLVNSWNILNIHRLEYYALEILSLYDAAGTLIQLPFAHMKILEEIWTRYFKDRATIIGFRGRVYKPQACEAAATFWNLAAIRGQLYYVLQNLDLPANRLFEDESRVSSKLEISRPRLAHSDLLLSVACSFESKMLSLFLDRGFSSSSYVSLFDTSIFKNHRAATVWVVFIAYLSGYSFRSSKEGFRFQSVRLFESLEQFLQWEDQEPVVILGRNLDAVSDSITHFTTLEQFVILCEPPNMQELLRLLARWRKDDDAGRVKVPWGSRKWEPFGVVDRPTYQTADSLEHFDLEGVASDREIITDLKNMGFRLW